METGKIIERRERISPSYLSGKFIFGLWSKKSKKIPCVSVDILEYM